MGSEPPPSVDPPARSLPPEPGSAAYRSSSAPTTSIAPPPAAPGVAWLVARLLIAVCLLALAAQAETNRDQSARGFVHNALSVVSPALLLAGLPMLVPRYRSLRLFSWLLLLAAFFQFYARKDGLLDAPVALVERVQVGQFKSQ